MTGVAFTLDDAAARAALVRAAEAAARPRGAMAAIGAHFVFSSKRNIEAETSPDGVRWPPLSPRTAEKRRGRRGAVRRGGANMLRVSLKLHDSIAYAATDAAVEWGSNVRYARVHQLGGVIDMPPRAGSVTLKKIRKKGGIRTRFARTGAKGGEVKTVSIRGHQVRIPARPYLGISAYDRQRVPEIVTEYLEREVRGA